MTITLDEFMDMQPETQEECDRWLNVFNKWYDEQMKKFEGKGA